MEEESEKERAVARIFISQTLMIGLRLDRIRLWETGDERLV